MIAGVGGSRGSETNLGRLVSQAIRSAEHFFHVCTSVGGGGSESYLCRLIRQVILDAEQP